jgi:hypothetical protein
MGRLLWGSRCFGHSRFAAFWSVLENLRNKANFVLGCARGLVLALEIVVASSDFRLACEFGGFGLHWRKLLSEGIRFSMRW